MQNLATIEKRFRFNPRGLISLKAKHPDVGYHQKATLNDNDRSRNRRLNEMYNPGLLAYNR